MTATLTAVTTESWKADVLDSDIPVLVDCWAEWCTPCRIIAPVLDEIAGEFAGKAKIVKLNIDQNPDIARDYQVMSIPNLLLFKDGQVVDSIVGVQPKRKIAAIISKAL